MVVAAEELNHAFVGAELEGEFAELAHRCNKGCQAGRSIARDLRTALGRPSLSLLAVVLADAHVLRRALPELLIFHERLRLDGGTQRAISC
jgi:hypothetical protein